MVLQVGLMGRVVTGLLDHLLSGGNEKGMIGYDHASFWTPCGSGLQLFYFTYFTCLLGCYKYFEFAIGLNLYVSLSASSILNTDL